MREVVRLGFSACSYSCVHIQRGRHVYVLSSPLVCPSFPCLSALYIQVMVWCGRKTHA